MTFSSVGLTALLFAALANAQDSRSTGNATLQGIVLDSHNGQPISTAVITLQPFDRTTGSDVPGRFQLTNLSAGTYTIRISAPGYLPLTQEVPLDPEEDLNLEISLAPRPSARIDAVTVEGNLPSESADPASLDRVSLKGDDLRNLSTVLADDSFRAVQGLPGVSANDDFTAQFSLRGAEFSRIGIFLDGIKLHNAVHSLEGADLSGSAGSFNTALVGQLDLYEGSYSEKFGDSSAGVLDIRLRDGSPDRYSGTLSVNFGTAGLSASGPFGRYNTCTWIAGFRKSYLQSLLAKTLTDPSFAFGIEDTEGRASCHFTQHNSLSLDIIDSHTNLDRSSFASTLGANALLLVNQHALTANLSWIYSPNDRLQIASHAAWMPDTFEARNPVLQPLGLGSYREKAWNTNATWLASPRQSISAGFSLRAIGENGFTEAYNTVRSVRLYQTYRGTGVLSGGYLQEGWTGLHNYVHLTAGGRVDHHSADGITAFSPQAGLTLKLLPSLNLQAGWGQYVQFPELSIFGSNLGSYSLLPLRSTQAVAALEQRLPWNTHIKASFYNRQDRNLLYQPTADPRVINGVVFLPPINPAYTNSVRGASRGVELQLQRASTSGLGGWISYAYGKAWLHDGVSNDSFPSNWDQRHTLNVYGTYRLRPSVSLSARWTYGSGFPAPGYFRLKDGSYYLSNERNRVRIGPYQRVDVRVNKTWQSEKWKKSLYIEGLNVSNKANYRFGSLDGYNPYTGSAYVSVDTMFPILPTVGFLLER